MKLPKEDVDLFYKLYLALLVYVNKKRNLVQGLASPDDFAKFRPEQMNKLRDGLYQRPELIDSFVIDNPWEFSAAELDMITSWRNFVRGKFIVLRYLKDYAIFLDPEEPPKAYGVLALRAAFEELVGSFLPAMVEAVLLPFGDRIISDGIFSTYRVTFGKGVRQSFNEAYQEAKSRFGIITSLPFSAEEVKQSDADKLRYYLKSERNRSRYWQEIADLIAKDSSLRALYHQEMGKVHARTYGKRLREIGLKDAWFALLQGMIIAGGSTKDEVEQILPGIVPPEKRKFVYVFQLKGK
jgi:hypothetical protein